MVALRVYNIHLHTVPYLIIIKRRSGLNYKTHTSHGQRTVVNLESVGNLAANQIPHKEKNTHGCNAGLRLHGTIIN